MTITINLDTEKAEFLKKLLNIVIQEKDHYETLRYESGKFYLNSHESGKLFGEVLTDVIGQLSRGIEKDFRENEAGIYKELMGAARQSGSVHGYSMNHDVNDFDAEPLIEDKGLPSLGKDRPMPPVKLPKN